MAMFNCTGLYREGLLLLSLSWLIDINGVDNEIETPVCIMQNNSTAPQTAVRLYLNSAHEGEQRIKKKV